MSPNETKEALALLRQRCSECDGVLHCEKCGVWEEMRKLETENIKTK